VSAEIIPFPGQQSSGRLPDVQATKLPALTLQSAIELAELSLSDNRDTIPEPGGIDRLLEAARRWVGAQTRRDEAMAGAAICEALLELEDAR
jgi:hypothetical protein